MTRLEYLKQYGSPNTVRAYESALKKFFETIYGKRDDLEGLAEKYFQEKRDIEQDIERFVIAIKDQAPYTRKLCISAVRIMLLENGVELPQLFWRRLRGRVKGSRAITEDKVPSVDELRKIIMHLPVHGKALFLTLASSGMRIGECLKLGIEDVELNLEPARVNIRAEYTKTGNKRITFISKEAKEAIAEWLKVREKWLHSAVGKSHIQPKNLEDKRLFPFSEVNARIMWRHALTKSGNGKRDLKTNITLMHPHVLRKFFRTQLGALSVDMTEALMGHEGYLTEAYRRYPNPEETLAEFYKKGEHLLLIFTEAGEVNKLRVEVEEKNRQLQQIINGLVSENMELKQKMQTADEKLRQVEDTLQEIKQFLAKLSA